VLTQTIKFSRVARVGLQSDGSIQVINVFFGLELASIRALKYIALGERRTLSKRNPTNEFIKMPIVFAYLSNDIMA
jgi:hypothetical protein